MIEEIYKPNGFEDPKIRTSTLSCKVINRIFKTKRTLDSGPFLGLWLNLVMT